MNPAMDLLGLIVKVSVDAESYKIEGTVAPGSSPVVVKPDGTRYQCQISPRGKVQCECPGFTYRGKCKHTIQLEEELHKSHPETLPKKKLRKEMTPEELQAERRPLEQVKPVVEDILKVVSPALSKYEIVGSYRRGKKDVHDVDIIAIGSPTQLVELAKEHLKMEPVQSGATIVRFNVNGLLIDFTFVPNEGEWGATLLYRTGPKDLNLIMRSRAKRMNMKLNEHGLFKLDGTLVAAKTEEEIFSALGMKFLTPEEREGVTLGTRVGVLNYI